MPIDIRITPANPFLVCSACRAKVDYWWQDGPPLCPSWGPVDGCRCQAHLGHVPHPPADEIPRAAS